MQTIFAIFYLSWQVTLTWSRTKVSLYSGLVPKVTQKQMQMKQETVWRAQAAFFFLQKIEKETEKSFKSLNKKKNAENQALSERVRKFH